MTSEEIKQYLSSKGIIYETNSCEKFEISSISNLQDIKENTICWIKTKKYLTEELISQMKSKGTVLVVCPFAIDAINCIITQNPKAVFFDILNRFFAKEEAHSISDKAVVLSDKIGKNVHIGANCFIGEDVVVGDNTVLYPNVSIISPCVIGHDCTISPGVVIGAEGFGYYFENSVPYREKHFMGVKIGNYVDIGSNTCIDRGLITDTVIKDHVKIDNLCHIGHNVVVEDNCLIIAGSIVCGSVLIKKNAYLSPGSVTLNQVVVEEKGKVGSNSLALGRVKSGTTVFGVPGRCITGNMRLD